MPSEGQGISLGLPEWLRRPSRIAYSIIVGGLALAAVWRIASYLYDWMRRRAGDAGVRIESLPGAFRLDVVRLFRWLFAWASQVLTMMGLRMRPREKPTQTTSVRRLYADMLRWGAESGFPRRASQTPFEYQRTLCMALPAHQADVTFITESYVRAKYGAQPPTEAQLHELGESRRRLKRRAARRAQRGLTSRPADKADGHGNIHR